MSAVTPAPVVERACGHGENHLKAGGRQTLRRTHVETTGDILKATGVFTLDRISHVMCLCCHKIKVAVIYKCIHVEYTKTDHSESCVCSILVILFPVRTAAVKHARCVFKTRLNSSDICSFTMSQHIVNVLIRAAQWACRQLSERRRLKGHERRDKPGVTGPVDAVSEEQIQTCLRFVGRWAPSRFQ